MKEFLIVIILLAKIFVIGGTLFFLVTGIINAVLVIFSTFIVKKFRFLGLPLSITAYIFYAYLYCGFGAFYSSLFIAYEFKSWAKWFVIFLCFTALGAWIRSARKSAFETIAELEQEINLQEEIMILRYTGFFNEKIYQTSMTVSGLKTAPFAMASFFLFLFIPDYIDIFFGQLPYWFAALFN